MSNHLPSTESNVRLNQTKTFNMPNSTKVIISYLFSFYSIFALNQRNKWLLQNEKKMPTTTLKAPKARGGLPSGVGSRYTVIL